MTIWWETLDEDLKRRLSKAEVLAIFECEDMWCQHEIGMRLVSTTRPPLPRLSTDKGIYPKRSHCYREGIIPKIRKCKKYLT